MYISVDLGGTNIRVAGSESLRELSFNNSIKRELTSGDYTKDIDFVISACNEIAGENQVIAAGIGIPGTLNDQKTVLLSANNLHSWEGQPFTQELKARLLCDVYADHDGVAAGIGESYYDDVPAEFAYLIWGTGIGGASVRREGEVIKAAREFTWRDYFRPWEAECGGAALTETHKKPTAAFTEQEWQAVYDAFSKRMDAFIQETGVEHIVFGGGLAVKHANFVNTLGAKRSITTQVSRLGENSGLYGGFGLIRQNMA